MTILSAFIGFLKMNIFEIAFIVMGFLSDKLYNKPLLRGLWKIAKLLGVIHESKTSGNQAVLTTVEDNAYAHPKDMIVAEVAKDPKKINSQHYPLTECELNVIHCCVIVAVTWGIIHGFVRLVRTRKKDKPMLKRLKQEGESEVFHEFQSCEDEMLLKLQANENDKLDLKNDERVDLKYDEDNWFYNFQDDQVGVFPDLESEQEEAIFDLKSNEKSDEQMFLEFEEMFFDFQSKDNWFQDDLSEVYPDFETDEEEASLDLESYEKKFLNFNSEKQNESLNSPFQKEEFPDFSSKEGESSLFLNPKEKELSDFSSDEERLSYSATVEQSLLYSHPKEMGSSELPAFPSDNEVVSPYSKSKVRFSDEETSFFEFKVGFPDLPSDEEELSLYFKAREERFPDLSSDEEEERFLSVEALPDLPSDEEQLIIVKQCLLYSKSKETRSADLPSDHEELPIFSSDEEDISSHSKSKERFPDEKEILPNSEITEGLLDLPSDEEEMFLSRVIVKRLDSNSFLT